MEGHGSGGLAGRRLSEGFAGANSRHRQLEPSSWSQLASLEVYGHRHAMHQRRRRREQRLTRRPGFWDLRTCTEEQLPSLARKHSDSILTENLMPRTRRGRSGCFHRTDDSAALSPTHVVGPPRAALCPLSLQVGMELALFAVHLWSEVDITGFIPSDQTAGASAPPAYNNPAGSNVPPQHTEESLPSSEEDPGVLPSTDTTTTRQEHVALAGLREGRSQLVNTPRHFMFSLGSSAVWTKLLRAYGLADASSAHSVELLLRRALESLQGSAPLLERPGELPDGGFLQRVLSSRGPGSLCLFGALRAPCAGAATRCFSSPLPSRLASPCRTKALSSSPRRGLPVLRQCGDRRTLAQMPLDAQRHQQWQPRPLSPAVQQQQRCQQQLPCGEPRSAEASTAVARIRAILEAHTEALQHADSSMSPASLPLSPENEAHRPGRPLVRLQMPERAVAFPSLSAPPPVVTREPQGDGERAWRLVIPHEARPAAEGLSDATEEGVSERPGGAAIGRPGNCEEPASAAGSRRRPESAGPRTSEPRVLEPPTVTDNISMSIRSREGSLILHGRFMPPFRGQQQASSRNNGECVTIAQPLESTPPYVPAVPMPPAQHPFALSSGPQQQQTATQSVALEESGGPANSGSFDVEAQTRDALGLGSRHEVNYSSSEAPAASSPTTIPWDLTDVNGMPQWEQRTSPTILHSPATTPSRTAPLQVENLVAAYSPQLLPQGPSYQYQRACADTGMQVVNTVAASQTQPLSTCTQQPVPCGEHLYDPRPQPSPRDGSVSVSWPGVPQRPPSLRMDVDRLSHPEGEDTARLQEPALPETHQQHSGVQELLYSAPRTHRRDGQQSPAGHQPEMQGTLPLHLSSNTDRGSQTQDPDDMQQRPRQQPLFLQQTHHRQRMPHQQDGVAAISSSAGSFSEPIAQEYLSDLPIRRGTPLQQVQPPRSQPPAHAPRLGVTGTPLVPLNVSYPHDISPHFERLTRPSPNAQIEGPAYRGTTVPASSAASTGGLHHLGPPDRGQAFLARRHRGGSLSSSDANSGPSVHAGPGWVDVSNPVDQSMMQGHFYAGSAQGGSRPQGLQQQHNSQLQQHVVEQWMRKTETHMEGLERLMQRLMFILEAVEARELGLN